MLLLLQDVVVPISAMTPPFKGIRKKEMERLASQILFPVTVVGDRQYYLSIHAGKLFEPQVWSALGPVGAAVALQSVNVLSTGANAMGQKYNSQTAAVDEILAHNYDLLRVLTRTSGFALLCCRCLCL